MYITYATKNVTAVIKTNKNVPKSIFLVILIYFT